MDRWIPWVIRQPVILNTVQIPLWSMNTSVERHSLVTIAEEFRIPPWSDEYHYPTLPCFSILRSDSSMVDEYRIGAKPCPVMGFSSDSSMVDEYDTQILSPFCYCQFRFLYGRWIPGLRSVLDVDQWVEFRFLYGRWISTKGNWPGAS